MVATLVWKNSTSRKLSDFERGAMAISPVAVKAGCFPGESRIRRRLRRLDTMWAQYGKGVVRGPVTGTQDRLMVVAALGGES